MFEIDLDGSVTSGNRAIDITSATTPESVARLIETSIKGALLNVNVKEVAPGTLQIQGSRQVSIDPVDSGLILTGKTGVQTGFGIQIPLIPPDSRLGWKTVRRLPSTAPVRR